MKNLIIFDPKVLVHRYGEVFHLSEGTNETIALIKRHGDALALAVLGEAKEQIGKVAFLETHGIHFGSIVVSSDETDLGHYLRSIIRLRQAKKAICIHKDEVLLRIARRAGARGIRMSEREPSSYSNIRSLREFQALYRRL